MRSRSEAYANHRSDGMRRAEDHVDEQWFKDAVRFVTRYCRTSEELFCDDLWTAGLAVPREARALGPVIMQCVRDGVMERSGKYRPSTGSNMTPKPVWRSLVFEGDRTRWFMIKSRDGRYALKPKRRVRWKTGHGWHIDWTPSRAKGFRFNVRSEAFDIRAALKRCRVISLRIHRIKVAILKPKKKSPTSSAGRKLRAALFPKRRSK
jgi:hypothetical protein